MENGNLSGNSVCRIKIYIGIPTQEMRSVQASLADLLQNVFQLPYCRVISSGEAQRFRETDGLAPYTGKGNRQRSIETHRDEDPYERVISGATCYTSVFGHWMGGRPGARRVDDHSEIIELIVDEEKIGAAFFLLITEFVLPALCRSGEDSVLFVVDHYGSTIQRLSRFEICRRFKANGPILRVSNLSATAKPWQIFPMDLLDAGLQALLRTVEGGSIRPREIVTGIHGKDELQFFSDSWCTWIQQLSLVQSPKCLWKVVLQPTDRQFHGACEVPSEEYQLPLPVVEIRLIVNHVSWWFFSNCGWLFPEGHNRTTPRESVIQLCRTMLNRIKRYWIGLDVSGDELPAQNYFRVTSAFRSSRDPMANAVMWLAFVYDQVLEFAATEAKPEVLYKFETVPTVKANTRECEFEALRELVLPYEKLAKPIKPNKPIEYLRSINDQYFPDKCYLVAWGYWFQFKEKLVDVRRQWESRIEAAMTGNFSPREAMDFDSWVSFERDWRSSDPLSRQWISPLVVETAFYWILANLLPHRCLEELVQTPIDDPKLLREAVENLFNPKELCGIGDTEAQHDSQGILLLRLVSQAVVSIPVRMPRRPPWWDQFDKYDRQVHETVSCDTLSDVEKIERIKTERNTLKQNVSFFLDAPRWEWIKVYLKPDILVRAIQHG